MGTETFLLSACGKPSNGGVRPLALKTSFPDKWVPDRHGYALETQRQVGLVQLPAQVSVPLWGLQVQPPVLVVGTLVLPRGPSTVHLQGVALGPAHPTENPSLDHTSEETQDIKFVNIYIISSILHSLIHRNRHKILFTSMGNMVLWGV